MNHRFTLLSKSPPFFENSLLPRLRGGVFFVSALAGAHVTGDTRAFQGSEKFTSLRLSITEANNDHPDRCENAGRTESAVHCGRNGFSRQSRHCHLDGIQRNPELPRRCFLDDAHIALWERYLDAIFAKGAPDGDIDIRDDVAAPFLGIGNPEAKFEIDRAVGK